METYDEVSDVQEETPINEGEVVVAEPEAQADPSATEPLHEDESKQAVSDKDVPDELVSKRHASNHVVMGWLMDAVNSHPEAEAIRSAILAAIARSKDHGLLEVLDNVKAYIASHDRISGI